MDTRDIITQNQLEKSLELCSTGSWRYNFNTKQFAITNEVNRIFGLDPLKLKMTYTDLLQIIHPDDRKHIHSSFLSSLDNAKDSYTLDFRIIDDDIIKHIQLKYVYESKGNDKPTHSYGIVQDISERKVLEQDNSIFASIIEQSNNSVVITDINGKIGYTNPKFTELTGYSPEEAKGLNPNILNAGTQTPSYYRKMWAAISNGNTWKGEFHNKTKEGKLYWENVTISPLKDDLGKTICFIATKEDITALKESEQRLKTLINSSPDIIYFKDGDGKWMDVNNSALNLFKLEKVEFKGKTNNEISINTALYKNTLLHCNHTDEIAWNKKAISLIEEIVPANNGEDKTYEMVKIPIFNDNGSRKSLIVIGRDITERKKASVSLKKSEEKYRRLATNTLDVIWTTDIDLNANYINDAIYWGLGYKPEEFINLNFSEFIHKDDINKLKEFALKIVNTANKSVKRKYDIILKHVHKNGKILDVKLTANPIFNKDGIVIGFQGRSVDVTTQVATREKLIIAKEKAEESDRLKSAFLANISHEIRTPMNGILGFISLLNDPNLTTDDIREYSHIIQISGNRMLNTINDIIDISKIETGQINISVSETEVYEQFNNLYCFFHPEAKQKNIRLSFIKNILADSILWINTDTDKFYIVMSNLIKNALKYTTKGSIEFGFEIKDEQLLCYVKDTGIGIKQDQHHAIFDRFTQVKSGSSYYEGTGIGLSIAKAYASKLGGDIWLESEEGVGSTFYFSTPVQITDRKKNMQLL